MDRRGDARNAGLDGRHDLVSEERFPKTIKKIFQVSGILPSRFGGLCYSEAFKKIHPTHVGICCSGPRHGGN